MNDLRDFHKPRRRGGKIVLVVTSTIALLVIAAVAIGCGSAKKSASTASNPDTGRHGTGIAYVKVFPSNQTLQKGVTTVIQLKQNLAFAVGVRNDGDYLEQNVKVTLVIRQLAPEPSITKTLSIAKISNGATKEVDFTGPYNIGTLISVVPIKVDVHPVVGEWKTTNNKATYEVRFAFSR
jgi:hypothetical protein